MKLQLKHIAPYLPYRLKLLRDKVEYNKFFGRGFDESIVEMSAVSMMSMANEGSKYKPILHPLSDLTKEIEHNGEKFVPIEWLLSEYGFTYLESETLPVRCWEYKVVQKLFEWHFDVFGLIEQGLSININEL